MLKMMSWLALAVGLLTAQSAFAADSDVTTVTLPDQFLVSRAAEGMTISEPQPAAASAPAERQQSTATATGIERQQDATLSSNNTIVAPIYVGGPSGTTSYLRFFNGQTSPAHINITIVGNRTGQVYGQANLLLPVSSSPQYAIGEILAAANVGSTFRGDDDGYSLYLDDPDNRGNNGFQHVIFNGNNSFFENASMCTYLDNERYEGINQILINVHTSYLADYPSYIYIHNTANFAVDYSAKVVDARTGMVIGEVLLQRLPAHATYNVPFQFFEQAMRWTPSGPEQAHVNLIFSGAPGYYAIVGQMIYNQRFGSYVNMTHFCAINHYDTGTP